MTIPVERTRAVLSARAFLYDLLDPAKTPRVPRPIRQRAIRVLRHYPSQIDMLHASEFAVSVFGEPEFEE